MNDSSCNRYGVNPVLTTIIFILVLTAACIQAPTPKTGPGTTLVTTLPQPAAQPADFPVLISTNGLSPVSGTITKNFSEIAAGNYDAVPILLDLEHTSYCGYTRESDYTGACRISLEDPRIRGMLQNGGIIKGIYIWGPPLMTKEQAEHPCSLVSLTLELQYKGRNITALVNESTRTVILPDD